MVLKMMALLPSVSTGVRPNKVMKGRVQMEVIRGELELRAFGGWLCNGWACCMVRPAGGAAGVIATVGGSTSELLLGAEAGGIYGVDGLKGMGSGGEAGDIYCVGAVAGVIFGASPMVGSIAC